MAEWSIAAVLKTVVLRGTGGSNPSLSAANNLQEVEFQPCRFFCAQKDAPKMGLLGLLVKLGLIGQIST